MASLFEKILKSVNSGVSIEEALAKHGTNQEVIDELLGVSSATNEHVLTKDTSTGKAIFKANPGGSTATTTSEGIVELATDAEVITGTDTSRVPSVSSLRGGFVAESGYTSLSGTSTDITGIDSWATVILIEIVDMSTDGTSSKLIQLGNSGGIETTNYNGSGSAISSTVSTTSYTTGFGIRSLNAAGTISGNLLLTRADSSSNTWTISGGVGNSAAANSYVTAGSKSLSAALDRVRFTTLGGTDSYDDGSVNLKWW